jgi:ABC-2 type transport system ATP-binding protein
MAANEITVKLDGVSKSFGEFTAVRELSLDVRAGRVFGLLGPNGAGKTTTIEICEGLTDPDAGLVEVLGRHWHHDERALRERLGIQLQETQLSDKLTVDETVTLFRSFYERGREVDEVIDVVQLGEKREARVGKLSGGQKQRLALACAIVGDPELLFLDEPTTGLDPQSRRQLWDLIVELRASGRSIVLTTHYMDEAEKLCDRVAIVDHGHVIALGTPRELIASLGAEHVVEFTTVDAPAGALDVESLQRLDGVRAAREHDGRWTLEVIGLARAVPALLAALSARGLTLGDLATHSATLEDVFVSLTGRQLRDA